MTQLLHVFTHVEVFEVVFLAQIKGDYCLIIYLLLLLIQETFIDPMVSKTLEQALWRIQIQGVYHLPERRESSGRCR